MNTQTKNKPWPRSDREREKTINWYVEKYQMKMKGSTPEIARDWVEGTNQPKDIVEEIWNRIQERGL